MFGAAHLRWSPATAGRQIPPRRLAIAGAALGGGALIALGVFLPWLTLSAGLQALSGVSGPNGRLLLGGAALCIGGGVAFGWRGGQALRWGVGLLGFALLAFCGHLTIELLTTYRQLRADPFTFAALGPGLFVCLGGAAVAFGTLFLPEPGPVPAHEAAPARDVIGP